MSRTRDDDQSAERPSSGRPRDPAIDDKIVRAARRVYRDAGHAGFHVDAVAKAAGVSRDAVYRRHRDVDSLLVAAFAESTWPNLKIDDAHPPRTALVTWGLQLHDYFATGDGAAHLRVHIEADRFPEVFQRYRREVLDPHLEQMVSALASRLRRTDGSPVDAGSLVWAISGAVMVHALFFQRPLSTDHEDDPSATVERIVDGALRGFA